MPPINWLRAVLAFMHAAAIERADKAADPDLAEIGIDPHLSELRTECVHRVALLLLARLRLTASRLDRSRMLRVGAEHDRRAADAAPCSDRRRLLSFRAHRLARRLHRRDRHWPPSSIRRRPVHAETHCRQVRSGCARPGCRASSAAICDITV